VSRTNTINRSSGVYRRSYISVAYQWHYMSSTFISDHGPQENLRNMLRHTKKRQIHRKYNYHTAMFAYHVCVCVVFVW